MTPEQEARRALRRQKRDDWKQRAADVDKAMEMAWRGGLTGHQKLLVAAAVSGSGIVRAEHAARRRVRMYDFAMSQSAVRMQEIDKRMGNVRESPPDN